jgi:FtsH ternary system domain X1
VNVPATVAFDWPRSAAQTALQVIEWAADTSGYPPSGSLNAVGDLPRSAATVRALRALTRATAAWIGAGQPPFGDDRPIGPGALFLAVAIGGRLQPELASQLAALVAPPALNRTSTTGWSDALARHAVAGPALAADSGAKPVSRTGSLRSGIGAVLSESMRDSLLRASPLSAVFFRPADGAAEQAANVALGMLSRPRGVDVLAAVLSGWHHDPRVLSWRTRLLARLAATHASVVVTVYAAARFCHGEEWDRRLSAAAADLGAAPARQPADLSVATIQYWAPMLVRQVSEQRHKNLLLDGYQAAPSMVRQFRLEAVDGL